MIFGLSFNYILYICTVIYILLIIGNTTRISSENHKNLHLQSGKITNLSS